MKILFLALLAVSTTLLANDADRVLVVRNGNSAISKAIADDYVRRRGIRHVLTIWCKDSSILGDEVANPDPFLRTFMGTKAETINLAAYVKDIEVPVRAYLSSNPGIDFIVLTKGIPIRIDGAAQGDGIDRFSLDSRLAALDYEELPDAIRVEFADPSYDDMWLKHFHRHFRANAWANRFWNSHERFSHARFGGYLVTRLDGYTEADAKALTTRSLRAEKMANAGERPAGKILLDIAPKHGFTGKAHQPYSILSERTPSRSEIRVIDEKSHLGDFNSGMQVAADVLKARRIPLEMDVSGHFIGHRFGLMGYVSWGSNDPNFKRAAYRSLRFAPGAIAETAVSTSGRTFLPTQGGQTLAADLIAQGVTGVKGYVDEPLVQAVAAPSILFDRYTRGWTLAESLYAASAFVGWQDVIIGDPLCRAYPPQ
jgi:uncharacterized protein (TIGR03790 family)